MDLAPDEAPAAAVDEAVTALASAEHLQTLLEDIADVRLADLLIRAIARVDEQPQPDVLGGRYSCYGSHTACLTAAATSTYQALTACAGSRRISSKQPSTLPERREVARGLVVQAPTLSQRVEMLYAFMTRLDDRGDPELELFRPVRGSSRGSLTVGLRSASSAGCLELGPPGCPAM